MKDERLSVIWCKARGGVGKCRKEPDGIWIAFISPRPTTGKSRSLQTEATIIIALFKLYCFIFIVAL